MTVRPCVLPRSRTGSLARAGPDPATADRPAGARAQALVPGFRRQKNVGCPSSRVGPWKHTATWGRTQVWHLLDHPHPAGGYKEAFFLKKKQSIQNQGAQARPASPGMRRNQFAGSGREEEIRQDPERDQGLGTAGGPFCPRRSCSRLCDRAHASEMLGAARPWLLRGGEAGRQQGMVSPAAHSGPGSWRTGPLQPGQQPRVEGPGYLLHHNVS